MARELRIGTRTMANEVDPNARLGSWYAGVDHKTQLDEMEGKRLAVGGELPTLPGKGGRGLGPGKRVAAIGGDLFVKGTPTVTRDPNDRFVRGEGGEEEEWKKAVARLAQTVDAKEAKAIGEAGSLGSSGQGKGAA